MTCPRCEDRPLEERDRDGVTIDLCPRCRGIWLDRGELEKLIARARAEDEDTWRTFERDGGRRRDDDDDDDDVDGDRRRGARPGPDGRRKRRWFESFGDLFD